MNRGAIEAARNEAQLAGVLAHEIAHISQRHSARQLSNVMVTNLGLSLLGALLGNAGGATAANIAARYVASGAFLKFSRDDEREADRVGAAIMARAGWDPHGMIELMQTIREQRAARSELGRGVFLEPPRRPRIASPAHAWCRRKRSGKRDSPARSSRPRARD